MKFCGFNLYFSKRARFAYSRTVGFIRKALTFNRGVAYKLTPCILVAAFILAGCIHKTKALRKQVARYEGDGVIRDASIAVFPIERIPGFRIAFPDFDPNWPYQTTYTFKGVPKTKSRESMIYVRFPRYSQDFDEIKKSVTSVLSYAILDESGSVLTTQNIIFSNAWWSGSWESCALWMDKPGQYGAANTFYFVPTNRYTLRIKYEPGPSPPQTTNMFMSIENGGRI